MSEILIYKAKNGQIELNVNLADDTVWQTQKQMADLFDAQRPAITKHLKNILTSNELEESSVRSILEHTAQDGKHYKTKFYNLDAIISIGYRINSTHVFLFYLKLQNLVIKLDENGLVALALLVAKSNPVQKDLMVHLPVD